MMVNAQPLARRLLSSLRPSLPASGRPRAAASVPAARPSVAAPGRAASGEGAPLLEPRLLQLLEKVRLVTRGRLAMHGQGDRRSPARGSSLQLVDYRAYAPGDDLRQIDWNVYGRTGDLFVRRYEDERVLTVHLLIDVSRSMEWGAPSKREAALRLAAALGYVALSGADRVVVGFLADKVVAQAGPYWGQHQRAALFRALANAPVATTTDFAASVGGYIDRVRSRPDGNRSLFVFLTDLLSPTAESGLRRLASGANYECTVLQVLAPDELDPEPSEDVELVDRETGQTVELNLDLATLGEYQRRLAAWTERLAQLCRERNARYLQISSAEDLETGTLRRLRLQGVLA